MAIVYQHRRLDTNEIFYIGIGKTEKRAYSINNRNKHWHNIINKTSYIVEIIFKDIEWNKAQQKEIELIKLYGRKDKGLGSLVNMTDGGEGVLGLNFHITEETRKKLSESQKRIGNKPPSPQGRKLSEETRKKLSDTHKRIGNKPPSQKGKKRSEETKLKMRQKRSEESKIKMSISQKLRFNKLKYEL